MEILILILALMALALLFPIIGYWNSSQNIKTLNKLTCFLKRCESGIPENEIDAFSNEVNSFKPYKTLFVNNRDIMKSCLESKDLINTWGKIKKEKFSLKNKKCFYI